MKTAVATPSHCAPLHLQIPCYIIFVATHVLTATMLALDPTDPVRLLKLSAALHGGAQPGSARGAESWGAAPEWGQKRRMPRGPANLFDRLRRSASLHLA